ncbi:hypothetical protein Q1695_013221 [Nippostrongylus brasiliensis]|nr:hypothetical protein Q1695_013221 [Nippostrongylus brasiliensis]
MSGRGSRPRTGSSRSASRRTDSQGKVATVVSVAVVNVDLDDEQADVGRSRRQTASLAENAARKASKNSKSKPKTVSVAVGPGGEPAVAVGNDSRASRRSPVTSSNFLKQKKGKSCQKSQPSPRTCSGNACKHRVVITVTKVLIQDVEEVSILAEVEGNHVRGDQDREAKSGRRRRLSARRLHQEAKNRGQGVAGVKSRVEAESRDQEADEVANRAPGAVAVGREHQNLAQTAKQNREQEEGRNLGQGVVKVKNPKAIEAESHDREAVEVESQDREEADEVANRGPGAAVVRKEHQNLVQTAKQNREQEEGKNRGQGVVKVEAVVVGREHQNLAQTAKQLRELEEEENLGQEVAKVKNPRVTEAESHDREADEVENQGREKADEVANRDPRAAVVGKEHQNPAQTEKQHPEQEEGKNRDQGAEKAASQNPRVAVVGKEHQDLAQTAKQHREQEEGRNLDQGVVKAENHASREAVEARGDHLRLSLTEISHQKVAEVESLDQGKVDEASKHARRAAKVESLGRGKVDEALNYARRAVKVGNRVDQRVGQLVNQSQEAVEAEDDHPRVFLTKKGHQKVAEAESLDQGKVEKVAKHDRKAVKVENHDREVGQLESRNHEAVEAGDDHQSVRLTKKGHQKVDEAGSLDQGRVDEVANLDRKVDEVANHDREAVRVASRDRKVGEAEDEHQSVLLMENRHQKVAAAENRDRGAARAENLDQGAARVADRDQGAAKVAGLDRGAARVAGLDQGAARVANRDREAAEVANHVHEAAADVAARAIASRGKESLERRDAGSNDLVQRGPLKEQSVKTARGRADRMSSSPSSRKRRSRGRSRKSWRKLHRRHEKRKRSRSSELQLLLEDSAKIPKCTKKNCKLCKTLEKRRRSQERAERAKKAKSKRIYPADVDC